MINLSGAKVAPKLSAGNTASKRCKSYLNTFKCLVMGLVKIPVNIMNHMSAEATAGNISFNSSTMTMWTLAEYLMIMMLLSGLLGNGFN